MTEGTPADFFIALAEERRARSQEAQSQGKQPDGQTRRQRLGARFSKG